MASFPPPPNNVTSLLVEAENLTKNTGIIVLLIVINEILIYYALFFMVLGVVPTPTGFTVGFAGGILTAILPLQTALVGYANKDAANQRQALMAISAVSILSLSHQSNWLINSFSWEGFAKVVASSASIVVSAVAILFNTGFHGHYKRVPVYAFVIVISVLEGVSAVVVAADIWSLQCERRSSHDSNDYFDVPGRVKQLSKQLEKAFVGEDAQENHREVNTELKDRLNILVMKNRDYFKVRGPVRFVQAYLAGTSGVVFLCLMSVAAADTHGFERVVLSLCAVSAVTRYTINFIYSICASETSPEVCQGKYGLRAALQYFGDLLSTAPGSPSKSDLPVLLKAWYEALETDSRDVIHEAFLLSPAEIRMEISRQAMPTSLVELAEKAVAVGFGPGRKLRWSKMELNLFLVWYSFLLELQRFESEGRPTEDCTSEDGVGAV